MTLLRPSVSRTSRSRGFTLVEVVVALVIVLVLAAVALPNVSGFLQQKRVDATIELLDEIADALVEFNASLNNTHAGRLSELSTAIIAGNSDYATGTDDSCGGTFTNGQRNAWDSDGPFVNFLISRDSGLVTPIGLARDSLTRLPNSGTAGFLIINFINSVELPDAKLLDEAKDAADGNNAGAVRWIEPAVDGRVSMFYRIPINSDC